MANWQQVLARVASDVEGHFDELKYRLRDILGGPDPIKIVPYRGYGTRERLYLKGRVLEDPGITPLGDRDSLWGNLLNLYRRAESDEVPHARLVARFQSVEQEIVANEEGFFELWLKPPHPLASDQMWHAIELELIGPRSPKQTGPVRATGQVLVPPESARYVVISDIDDTVIKTDVAHLWAMARNVFLGNARTRLPFLGVAAFYRALHAGGDGDARNPLFYVSSSPWNLYDLLSEFFQLNDIPVGPVLFLRDWGITEQELLPTGHRDYKLRVIRQMLDFYPHLPFILIGDSSQEDPEIYYEVVKEYPSRILAVYIRNVSRDLDRPETIRALAQEVLQAGSTLLLADDTLAIARHAAEQGWIRSDTLAEIGVEKAKDQAPPSPLERLVAEEKGAPTVVVETNVPAESERKQQAIEEGAIESALQEGEAQDGGKPTVIEEDDSPKL